MEKSSTSPIVNDTFFISYRILLFMYKITSVNNIHKKGISRCQDPSDRSRSTRTSPENPSTPVHHRSRPLLSFRRSVSADYPPPPTVAPTVDDHRWGWVPEKDVGPEGVFYHRHTVYLLKTLQVSFSWSVSSIMDNSGLEPSVSPSEGKKRRHFPFM